MPRYSVPMSRADANPIMCSIIENPRMGSWDARVDIGNFATETEARKAVEGLQPVLEAYFKTKLRAEGLVREEFDH